VPGWSKKQLKVVQKDNELRIVGTKSTEGGDNYLHQGLSAKSFDKTFVLNSDLKVNSIKLKDGLLTVDITKDSSKEVEFDIS
jgi:molecular chaperone IbpA